MQTIDGFYWLKLILVKYPKSLVWGRCLRLIVGGCTGGQANSKYQKYPNNWLGCIQSSEWVRVSKADSGGMRGGKANTQLYSPPTSHLGHQLHLIQILKFSGRNPNKIWKKKKNQENVQKLGPGYPALLSPTWGISCTSYNENYLEIRILFVLMGGGVTYI